MSSPSAIVRPIADEAQFWLLTSAAPMWANGRNEKGLFAERILLDGRPDAAPYRVFVQARHIYAFAEIGRLGWSGPWASFIDTTINLLISRARRRDGFYVNSLDIKANVHDARADLYVQAFVLFALGRAGEALGRTDLFDEAERLAKLLDDAWKHQNRGYHEGEIVEGSVRRQNPHMHLLEAFLVLSAASGRARFAEAAEEIACLCRDNFIDPETGALLEYFDADWRPALGLRGQIVEPGHCFEWAWLFEKFGHLGWSDGVRLADRLTAFARATGIDEVCDVAINEVLLDGTIHNANARLWPQTERLKAAVARFRRTGEMDEVDEIRRAATGLKHYLTVDIPGLWRDKPNPSGGCIDEWAPGSSLYHITCGYAELIEAA